MTEHQKQLKKRMDSECGAVTTMTMDEWNKMMGIKPQKSAAKKSSTTTKRSPKKK